MCLLRYLLNFFVNKQLLPFYQDRAFAQNHNCRQHDLIISNYPNKIIIYCIRLSCSVKIKKCLKQNRKQQKRKENGLTFLITFNPLFVYIFSFQIIFIMCYRPVCNTESPFSVRFITRNEKSNYLKTNQQLLCMTSIRIMVNAGLDFIAEPLMQMFNNYI